MNKSYKENRVKQTLEDLYKTFVKDKIFPRIPRFFTGVGPGYKEMFEKCDRLGYEAFTPEMEKFVIPASLLILKQNPDEYLKISFSNKKADLVICTYEKPSYWSLDENDILNNTNKASNCLPESERREYELLKTDFIKSREQLEKCNLLLKQTPDDEKLLKAKKSMTQYSNDFATRFLKYGYKDIISDPGLVESYIKNPERFHYKILTVEWKNTNKWIEFYKRKIEKSKVNVKLYEANSSLRNFKHKFEIWFTENHYEIPKPKEKILPKSPILEDNTETVEGIDREPEKAGHGEDEKKSIKIKFYYESRQIKFNGKKTGKLTETQFFIIEFLYENGKTYYPTLNPSSTII